MRWARLVSADGPISVDVARHAISAESSGSVIEFIFSAVRKDVTRGSKMMLLAEPEPNVK